MKETGKILKQKREELGITLQDAAIATKISSRILEALENGDQKAHPQKTFLRGFVLSYATFLKLDVKQVMQIFYNEMGSTRPEPPQVKSEAVQDSESETSGSPSYDFSLPQRKSLGNKIASLIGLTGLLLIILFVLKTVEKYESDSEIAKTNPQITPLNESENIENKEPDQKIIPTAPAVSMAPATPVDHSIETKPVEVVKESVEKKEDHIENSVSNEISQLAKELIDQTKNQVKPQTLEAPPATAKATSTTLQKSDTLPVKEDLQDKKNQLLVKEPLQAEKIAAQVIAQEKKKQENFNKDISINTQTNSTAHQTLPTPSLAPSSTASPPQQPPPPRNQEIILEALDSINVEVKVDDEEVKTITLNPEQIHTIKAKKSIKMTINDGGAVNIIHNGKDRGIPGQLGSPISISYPK